MYQRTRFFHVVIAIIHEAVFFFFRFFRPSTLLVGWSQRRNEQLNLETALYHMQLAKRLYESAHNSFATIYADNVVLIKEKFAAGSRRDN